MKYDAKPFDHDKARNEHMKRRRESAGLTHAQTGEEFNVSRSTSHRRIGGKRAPKEDRDGDQD